MGINKHIVSIIIVSQEVFSINLVNHSTFYQPVACFARAQLVLRLLYVFAFVCVCVCSSAIIMCAKLHYSVTWGGGVKLFRVGPMLLGKWSRGPKFPLKILAL